MKSIIDNLMRRRASALADDLEPHLPTSGILVDIGSGTGHNAAALRDRLPGVTFVECDTADFHVVGSGPIVIRDILPFRTNSVDVCLLQFILQYPPDPAGILREARRVTSTGGAIIVRQTVHQAGLSKLLMAFHELAWGPLAYEFSRLVAGVPAGASTYLRPRRLFSQKTLLSLCEAAGLRCRSASILQNGPGTCYDVILVLE